MNNIDALRHLSVFDPAKFEHRVNVIGAGSIGSKIVWELARLGISNIHVFDFDTVASHNLANQMFGNSHIGMKKVDALKEIIKRDLDFEINTYDAKVDGTGHVLSGVTFLAVDSMAARKEIFEKGLEYKPFSNLVIETRMGVDVGYVRTINPLSRIEIGRWKETLYSDDIAEVSACGSSITVGSTSAIIAGFAVWQMMSWATGKPFSNEIIVGITGTPMIIENQYKTL